MPLTINKIPVLLITGYLGSGKTTLLNRILTNEKGIRFAVIVNDIGEVNIDASLIQQGGVVSQQDDSLVALQNGCICCSLKMDLIQQLHDLVKQRQTTSNEIKPCFDYIVIEASGICEPAPIAQTLCSYAQMVPQFATDGLPVLDCICSVVDALRLRDEFDGGDALAHYVPKEEDLAALVIEQIEFSNLILLNKISEVSEDELARIKSIIRAIQPTAEIIETNYCDVPLEKLLNTHLFDFDRTATSAKWIQEVEDASHHHEHHHDDDDDEDEHEHHHHDPECPPDETGGTASAEEGEIPEEHILSMERVNGQWLMADFDGHKADCIRYIANNRKEQAIRQAISDYLLREIAPQYRQGELCVPTLMIVAEDEEPESVSVFGDFWVFWYNIAGDTLKTVSGGDHPGLITISYENNQPKVVAFERVEDGSQFTPSAKRIFSGRYDIFINMHSNECVREAVRREQLSEYVLQNDLNVHYYQDFGWEPKELEL